MEHTLPWLVRLHGLAIHDERRAEAYPFEPALLGCAATRIVNEIRTINRVAHDRASEPPRRIG